jgi:glycosyltransferase involved in cell wall biosynthesis
MLEISLNHPKIAVITVVKNHSMGLSRTIENLRLQRFEDWISIIVLGASTDNTSEVAQSFAQIDDRIAILTQKDTGIYEAMNLAVSESKSEFLWFMNAGDEFFDVNSLGDGVSKLEGTDVGFIVGGYTVLGQNRVYKQSSSLLTPFRFAFTRRGGCHQAMIFRRTSIVDNQLFNTKYRLASDYELCLKIMNNVGASKSAAIYAQMEPNGRTDNSLRAMHIEKLNIRNAFFLKSPWIILLSWIWMYLAHSKSWLKKKLKRK